MKNKSNTIAGIKLVLLCIMCLLGLASGIFAVNCAFLNKSVFYIIAGFISIAFQLYLTKNVGENILNKKSDVISNNSSANNTHVNPTHDSENNPIDYETDDDLEQ